jgi:hypothetical protein
MTDTQIPLFDSLIGEILGAPDMNALEDVSDRVLKAAKNGELTAVQLLCASLAAKSQLAALTAASGGVVMHTRTEALSAEETADLMRLLDDTASDLGDAVDEAGFVAGAAATFFEGDTHAPRPYSGEGVNDD